MGTTCFSTHNRLSPYKPCIHCHFCLVKSVDHFIYVVCANIKFIKIVLVNWLDSNKNTKSKRSKEEQRHEAINFQLSTTLHFNFTNKVRYAHKRAGILTHQSLCISLKCSQQVSQLAN